METVMFIGRILFAVMFVLSGINHFTKAEAMTGYAQFKGVPSPSLPTSRRVRSWSPVDFR